MNNEVNKKRFPALGPDAPAVDVTETETGEFVVDFHEGHAPYVAKLAAQSDLPAELVADLPWVGGDFERIDLTEAANTTEPADLTAFKVGDVVEWGDSGSKAFGIVFEIDAQNQQANIHPMMKSENGYLVKTGDDAMMVDIGRLKASKEKAMTREGWAAKTKPVAITDTTADLSDDQLIEHWQNHAGIDDTADLADEGPGDLQGLNDDLRRQSAERSEGPDPDSDERSQGLLETWRRLFRQEDS